MQFNNELDLETLGNTFEKRGDDFQVCDIDENFRPPSKHTVLDLWVGMYFVVHNGRYACIIAATPHEMKLEQYRQGLDSC